MDYKAVAMKRLTIQIDGLSDQSTSTSIPEGLQTKEVKELKTSALTTSTVDREDQETISPEFAPSSTKAFGRTYPDIFAEFINNGRVMATLLTFLSFVVFAFKTDTLADLLIPAIIAVLLNIVWFLGGWVQKVANKKI